MTVCFYRDVRTCRALVLAWGQGYTYSLCPFKEVKQDKHSLGKWKSWGSAQGKDRHRSMLFDGGSRCHNKKKRCAYFSRVGVCGRACIALHCIACVRAAFETA